MKIHFSELNWTTATFMMAVLQACALTGPASPKAYARMTLGTNVMETRARFEVSFW